MNTHSPLVSVVVPCYNRLHLLPRAIRSVLAQTLADWELVVVDDGSHEDVGQVLAQFPDHRLRLVRHQQNRGDSAARNTGMQEARGRFIALLDSDDEWLPRKLERQLAAVLGAPSPDRVFCLTKTVVVLSEKRRIVRPRHGLKPGSSFAEFLLCDGGFAQTSSFFFARSLFEQVKFDECLRQMNDTRFFCEMGTLGLEYRLVQEPLTIWYNEQRGDRITTHSDYPKWRDIVDRFLAVSETFISPRTRLAMEARFLSQHLWKHSRLNSVRLLLRAHAGGALSTVQVLELFSRNVMPSRSYNTVRHWLTNLKADTSS